MLHVARPPFCFCGRLWGDFLFCVFLLSKTFYSGLFIHRLWFVLVDFKNSSFVLFKYTTLWCTVCTVLFWCKRQRESEYKAQIRPEKSLQPPLFVFRKLERWTGGRNRRYNYIVVCRAGHETTLPRQRDHVFRPQSLLVIALLLYSCGYTPFWHR